MPFAADYNQIFINGFPYIVQPGHYTVDELPYFQEQGTSDQPNFSAYIPEYPVYWDTWHHGYGALYLDKDTTMSYYTTNGCDASIKSQITLATAYGTTGISGTVSIGQNVVEFKELKGTLFAVASTVVLTWDPTASPNGWAIGLNTASAGGAIGKTVVFTAASIAGTLSGGAYLYVPTGSQAWLASASKTWVHYPSPAAHFEVVNNSLWTVYYDQGNQIWKVAKSADGWTFSAPNVLNPIAQSGAPTMTWLLNYDNRLEILSTEGMSTIDGSGNVVDLLPEIGQYGDPHVGAGANTWHGMAYIPSNYGLLEYAGSQVLNPNTLVSARSMGPDQSSWSQSDVRGKFASITPHVNYMYGAINSQANNGFVLKYRDFPDIVPGEGWHPIIKFPNAAVGAVKVSALNWYGTTSYPILWMSAGSGNYNIYQARLPQDNDNPLLDPNVLYQATGTFDLPIVDDNMPTLQKEFIKYVADVSVPSGTYIQMQAAIDGTVYSNIGGLITGTTGIVEWPFNTNGTYGYKLLTRVQMTSSTSGLAASQTPVMRSLVMHHYVRPVRRRYWQMDLIAQDDVNPNDNSTSFQKIQNLDTVRRIVAPVVWQDLLGQGSLGTMQKFTYSQAERQAGKGVEWLAHVEMQDYPIVNFFTMSAVTMYSFTS